MALAAREVLDLAGSPRNPWAELRLIWRVLQEPELIVAPAPLVILRPALARAA